MFSHFSWNTSFTHGTYDKCVSIRISIDLGKNFSPVKKNCCRLNLDGSLCIFTFFLFSKFCTLSIERYWFFLNFDMAWHWKPEIHSFCPYLQLRAYNRRIFASSAITKGHVLVVCVIVHMRITSRMRVDDLTAICDWTKTKTKPKFQLGCFLRKAQVIKNWYM